MTVKSVSAAFPYQPRFLEVLGSQMHYVEEGSGDPVLFLHGNPSSSYLWRNIIPHLSPLARCIAPDLIGMGKSEKPDIEYRFVDHARYVDSFIEEMGLENVTLVVHDWGSALGFYYAMRHESAIKGLAFMEAIIMPVPSWEMFPETSRDLFQSFRNPDVGWDMVVTQNMFIEDVLPAKIVRTLSEEEMDRYREPFKEPSARKPVWRWPNEIPIAGEPPDVVEIVTRYNQWLQETALPKLLFYGSPGELIQAPVLGWCREHLTNLKVVNIGPGIHYLQEDNPQLIGTELARWYAGL